MARCVSLVTVSLLVVMSWSCAGVVRASVSSQPACNCTDPSLCAMLSSPMPKRQILAFHTSGGSHWMDYDWTQVTTVTAFGTLDPALLCYAHARGVRVTLGTGYDKAQLGNATARSEFADQLVEVVKTAGVDGINLDIEGNRANRDDLTALVAGVRAAFEAAFSTHTQITFDTSVNPRYSAVGYDYAALIQHLDFFMVMAYDMCWGTSVARANCPLPTVKALMAEYLAPPNNIAPSQLVLGLPWYGYKFPCNTTSGPCEWTVPFGGGSWQIGYGNAMAQFEASGAVMQWDAGTTTPYFSYMDGARRYQIWLDNPESLAVKYGYAGGQGFLGVGFWTADELNYANASQSAAMWDALHKF